MAISYIYSLSCPDTYSVKYVGKSRNPAYRLRKHIEESKRGVNTKKCRWILGLIKNGKYPILNIEEITDTENENFWEKHYISLYKFLGFDLKNHTQGGDGGSMSLDVIDKIRKSNIGRKSTEYQKKVVSNIMKGNSYAKGNRNRAKEICCIDLLKCVILYYESTSEAAREIGIGRSAITNNLSGLSNTVLRRYKFSFA